MKVIRNREPADWRKDLKLSLPDVARMLSIEGKNPARQIQRYETGEVQAPPDIIEAYRRISGGHVTPESFHAVRLRFCQAKASAEGKAQP